MADISMNAWKQIWESKQADARLLEAGDLKSVFMELKRIDGNDTLGGNGVQYDAYMKQYLSMKKNMCGERESIQSVFEAGCGSGPFLLLFETDGFLVGGMDYSRTHIDTAVKVLKAPMELYCDEAINISSDQKYDCVYSNSMFEYFESTDYALKVLDKMCRKSNYCIAVLDVHDKAQEEKYLAYRRQAIDNYDEKYKGLHKLFIDKTFFTEYAAKNKMDIKITSSKLNGYWNADFVFDVYLYKTNV